MANVEVRRIDVRRESEEMAVEWSDGLKAAIALSELRRKCPCALCEDHREKQLEADGLLVLDPTDTGASAEVLDVTAVGRYAIQINWADGHDTGIYTYEFLRSLGAANELEG